MKDAGTAIIIAMRQLITCINIYIVINVTLNITQDVLCARVHCVILKGTLSKVVCLFIKLDANMRTHPGEMDLGTSVAVPFRVWMRSWNLFTASQAVERVNQSKYKAA